MADGSDRPATLVRHLRSAADTAGFVALWGWILLSLFFVPVWLGIWWLGIVCFLVGLVVCAAAAAASAYPVTTVGTRRRVDVDPVRDEAVACDECGCRAAGGERRRFATDRVLFGTVVSRPESGTNVYCRDCVEAESGFRDVTRSDEGARLERERSRS